jgi:signal transduction histidine kinase
VWWTLVVVLSVAGAHLGWHGRHLEADILLVLAAAAWLIWIRLQGTLTPLLLAIGLLVMSVAGGLLTNMTGTAEAFVAVAGIGAGMNFDLTTAGALALSGPLVRLIDVEAQSHHGLYPVAASFAFALAGVMVGLSRRQYREQSEQLAQLQLAQERVVVEHERAELLAERNRLAREIHDVLAHTLGAVSVQLQAVDAQLEGDVPEAKDSAQRGLRTAQHLVSDGLDEVRRSVAALRDDAPPLSQQLRLLYDASAATLALHGSERPLPPPVTLTLFRVAQETLTNALKHAPGAPVRADLSFEAGRVRLRVSNGCATEAPGEPALQGGGYGVQGMRERVLLLGGELTAGPHDEGWAVEATVPT